jgi:hypothetical protein
MLGLDHLFWIIMQNMKPARPHNLHGVERYCSPPERGTSCLTQHILGPGPPNPQQTSLQITIRISTMKHIVNILQHQIDPRPLRPVSHHLTTSSNSKQATMASIAVTNTDARGEDSHPQRTTGVTFASGASRMPRNALFVELSSRDEAIKIFTSERGDARAWTSYCLRRAMCGQMGRLRVERLMMRCMLSKHLSSWARRM